MALYPLSQGPLSTLRYLTLSTAHGRSSKRLDLNSDDGFRGSLTSQTWQLSTLRYLTLSGVD